MNKYLIKREIRGAWQIPSEKLNEIGKGSQSVLIAIWNEGKKIEQEHSYIAGNNFFLSIMLIENTLLKNTQSLLELLQMK